MDSALPAAWITEAPLRGWTGRVWQITSEGLTSGTVGLQRKGGHPGGSHRDGLGEKRGLRLSLEG